VEKDRAIGNCFIICNIKIKGNTLYHFLIEMIIFLIERMAMTRYIMYQNKINNMEDERLPKI
jgi:hypothetical protein